MNLNRCTALGLLLATSIAVITSQNLGCKKTTDPIAAESSGAITSEALVGKWKLVTAGGKPPAEVYIQSQEIEIAADGSWSSSIVVQPPQRAGNPDRFNGKGNWSLTNGLLNYTYKPDGPAVAGSGLNSGTARVQLASGRLTVTPDCFMQARKPGPDAAGEYERMTATTRP